MVDPRVRAPERAAARTRPHARGGGQVPRDLRVGARRHPAPGHAADSSTATRRRAAVRPAARRGAAPLAHGPDRRSASPTAGTRATAALRYCRGRARGRRRSPSSGGTCGAPTARPSTAEVRLHRVDLAERRLLQAIVRDVTERHRGRGDAAAPRGAVAPGLAHGGRGPARRRRRARLQQHPHRHHRHLRAGARCRLPDGDRRRRDVEEIRRSAQRAAALTSQLLAFSRKQVIAPVPCDLNELVRGALAMLRRLIGEDIELVVRPGAAAGDDHVDRTPARAGAGEPRGQRPRRHAGRRARSASPPSNAELDESCAARPRRAARARYVRLDGVRHRHRHARRRASSTSSSRSSPPRRSGAARAWAWPRCTASCGRAAASSSVDSRTGPRHALHALLPATFDARAPRRCRREPRPRAARPGDHPAGRGRGGRCASSRGACSRSSATTCIVGGRRRGGAAPGARAGRADRPAADRRHHAGHERAAAARELSPRAARPARAVHVGLHVQHPLPAGRAGHRDAALQKPFSLAGFAAAVRESLDRSVAA